MLKLQGFASVNNKHGWKCNVESYSGPSNNKVLLKGTL